MLCLVIKIFTLNDLLVQWSLCYWSPELSGRRQSRDKSPGYLPIQMHVLWSVLIGQLSNVYTGQPQIL